MNQQNEECSDGGAQHPPTPHGRQASRPCAGRCAAGDSREHDRGEPPADVLRAMARDPRCVFLYWRLEGPASRKLREEFGADASWAVRVENVTTGAQREIPVEPGARNYYLDVREGCRYVCELGVVAKGRFHAACRSNPVLSPPHTPPRGGVRQEAEQAGDFERKAARQPVGLTYESSRHRLTSSGSSASSVRE